MARLALKPFVTLILTGLLLSAREAWSAEAPVAVLEGQRDDLSRQLEQDLKAAGYRVVRTRVAAPRIVLSRSAGKVELRCFAAGPNRQAPVIVATGKLREGAAAVMKQVRECDVKSSAARNSKLAKPSTPPKEDPRLNLSAGVGLQYNPGGLPLGTSAFIAGAFFVTQQIGFTAHGVLPIAERTISSPEGSAVARATSVGIGGVYRLDPTAKGLRYEVEAGGGAMLLSLEGFAQAPYAGRTESASAPLLYAAGTAFLPVSNTIEAALRLQISSTLPALQVRFAEREVARFGAPVIGATLLVRLSR